MKSPLVLFALLLGSAAFAPAQSAILGKNLFPEGGFEIFGESRINPTGWNFPDRNDTPWKNGFRAEVVAAEGGGRELRVLRPEPVGSTMVQARLPLPAKVERLRVNYRLLPKQIVLGAEDPAGNGVGVWARFHDADSKPLRGGGWVGGLAKASDTEWQDREGIYNVPANARFLELHVLFRSASGEVRVDDIEVVPVTMSE